MNDILSWLSEYSPAIAILIIFAAATIFVLRTVVEKAVTSRLDLYAEEATLRLGRRSDFEARVLTDRYEIFVDLLTRLSQIATNINRIRHGSEIEGFMSGNEIVPLTAVYEELNIRKILLGEKLHDALREGANIALHMANYKSLSADQYLELESKWLGLHEGRIRIAAEEEFGMSRIRW